MTLSDTAFALPGPSDSLGPWLRTALSSGQALLSVRDDGGTNIRYVAADRTERFDDPEERVRAEFWAELIHRYHYPPDRIGVEITVPDRTPRDAADLVVFRDDARTRPFAVVECKREAIGDAEFAQAIEQAVGNGTWSKLRADYVGVVAGLTRQFLDLSDRYGVLERESNLIADLPVAYGRPDPFKYTKAGKLDLRPVSRDELIVTLAKCHQTLWGGGRLSPPAAFGELCKLIFVKLSDETRLRRKGSAYDFQIKTGESSRDLGDRVRSLYGRQQQVDPEIFSDPIRVSDATLRILVTHLEPLNLSATELDVKGVAFEQFMDGFFKGDFGQYFTPREIIRLAVDMIEPQEHETVIDPACGSGGFLLHALDFVRSEIGLESDDETEAFAHWSRYAQKNLYGIEINDELTRVAKMNMIIHGDGHTNIVGSDALVPMSDLRARNPKLKNGGFDVVLTNPPFGATVQAVSHPNLGDFELGSTSAATPGRRRPRSAQKTEILFVERVADLLKKGTGRAAIVLPDGLLANGGTKYVRDFMLAKFQVLAVVSLPATAFTHYGAAVKSSLVVVRRRADDEEPQGIEEIFMAAPQQIGYDATGRETPTDLPELLAAYRSHVTRSRHTGDH